MRTNSRLVGLTLSAPLAVCLLAGSAGTASAARRNPLDGQPAVRQRVDMRRMRFEITPRFLMSLNQDYKYAFGPGAMLQFHILDWIAVGVEGQYMFNANTPLEDEVRTKLAPGGLAEYQAAGGPRPTQGIHDAHVLGVNATASVFVNLTPFNGKLMLFSQAMLRYDMYLSLGVGMVNYTNGCPSAANCASGPPAGNPDPNLDDGAQYAGLKFGGSIGVGSHLFVNDWLGIQLEIRDYIVGANAGGLDVNGDRRLTSDDEGVTNNVFFGVGLTFLLPPRAKIIH